MNPFKNAVVIGTGMMGPGIAACLSSGGLQVRLVSRSPERAADAVETARRFVTLLIEHGLHKGPAPGDLSPAVSLEDALPGADLVIESTPEFLPHKQELFAKLDAQSDADTILASNTSGLSITEIASACARPERVMTTHFWNPPHLMPLVEIVKGAKTNNDKAVAVADLLRSCGKTPVLIQKDRPGQLGNRLQMALLREACHIVAEGIAGVAEVDLAAKSGFGLRLPVYGIFEHQDAVGLDLGLSVLDYVARDLCSEKRAPDLYYRKVASGKLGAKSGEGFYDWRERDMEAVKRRRDDFVLDFLKRMGPPAYE